MGINKPCCDPPAPPGGGALYTLAGEPLPDGAQLRAGILVTNGEGIFSQAWAFSAVIAVSADAAGGAYRVEFTADGSGIAGRVLTVPLTDLLGRRAQPAPGVPVHVLVVGVP